MKTRFIALCAAALVSVSAMSQEKKTPLSAEERAKQRTERMKEKLALTPEQEKKINEIYLKEANENDKQRKVIEEQRQKNRERHEKLETEVKSQLTPEQLAKYDEVRKDRYKKSDYHKGRGHKRGKRHTARG